MGYTLLWIESLAAALSFIAIAATGNFKSPLTKWLCVGIWLTIPLVVVGLEAAAVCALSASLFNWYVINTFSWLLCFIGGSVYILRTYTYSDVQSRGVFATGLFASVALFVITFWNLDSSVRLKLSSIRLEASAMGLSAAPPRPLDDENAALIYEEAFKILAGIKNESATDAQGKIYEHLGKPEFNTSRPEVREFLKKRQPVIALLKQATAMRGCFFERDYSKLSVDMPLPELGQMRECARLLAMDAQRKAADGHLQEAFENVAEIKTMARHIGAEPTLISGLVSAAINDIATKTFETLLTANVMPSADDLSPLKRSQLHSFDRMMHRCLAGEEALGLSVFGLLGENDNPEILTILRLRSMLGIELPIWRVYIMSDDLATYRDIMENFRKKAHEAYAERKNNIAIIEKEVQTHTGILTTMASMILPAVSRSLDTFTRAEASQRLSNLALAIANYRSKTGHFPETPEQLVPDYISGIPMDPFDEKNSLRYIAGKDGITIYSVGPNQKDDNGKASKTDDGDIVFHVGKTNANP